MSETGRRVLAVASGVASLAAYVALAWLLAVGVRALLADPPALPVVAAVVVGGGLAVGYLSYRAGARRILEAFDARPVPRSAAPRLHRRIDALADAMAVDPPAVYVAPLSAPNALAVAGRGGGVLVLDHRLPRLLRPDELDAILAHELAHLEGYDGLVQTLATSVLQTVAGLAFLALLPVGLAVAALDRAGTYLTGRQPAPLPEQLARTHYRVGQVVSVALLAFTLAIRAHSRRRELAADDRAAAVTDDPLALARALTRIQRASTPQRGLWRNLLVHADDDPLTRLLATHPPMDERIQRLRDKASERRRIPVETR